MMARSRFIYTLKEVSVMIGENLELIEEVTANSDNIAEGELVYVHISVNADSDFIKSRTLPSLIRGQFSRSVFEACC